MTDCSFSQISLLSRTMQQTQRVPELTILAQGTGSDYILGSLWSSNIPGNSRDAHVCSFCCLPFIWPPCKTALGFTGFHSFIYLTNPPYARHCSNEQWSPPLWSLHFKSGKQTIKRQTHWVNWTVCSVQFSRSVVSNSLRPHESQHTRPPCPSPTPRVYSDSCL